MEKWVAPAIAVEALAGLHDSSGRYLSYEDCLRVAEDTITYRLAFGQSAALAVHVTEGVGGGHEDYALDNEIVPSTFWAAWTGTPTHEREADWIAGDFRYATSAGYGVAFGVRFDVSAVPAIEPTQSASESGITSPPIAVSNAAADDGQAASKMDTRGRKPAPWWADFAEELVVQIHENGFPESRDALFNAVASSLAAQGKKEPGSTAGKQVIGNIWRRLGISG